MKIRLKMSNGRVSAKTGVLSIIVGAAMFCAAPTFAMRQGGGQHVPTQDYKNAVMSPALDEDEKVVAYVRDYQMSRAKSLVKAGFEVEMMRHREVVVIIIPTMKLFNAGSAEISAKGERRLREVLPYLGEHGFYNIVVAGYTDNTGSPIYCLRRSDEQAVAVADRLRQLTGSQSIMEFGMGNESPLLPNNTVDNRAVNRRIEILLVPGDGMLEQAAQE